MRKTLSSRKPAPAGPSAAPSSLEASAFTRWLALAAVALTVFVLTFHPIHDPDAWFHLALGRFVLQKGTWPVTDPFSYTAGDWPYVPSGWLTAVLMAWLDGLYPESSLGPILMVTGAVGAAAALVLWRAWRAGALVGGALVLLAGLALAVTRFSPRPDVWSMPCFVAVLWLLSRAAALVADVSQAPAADDARSPFLSSSLERTLWLLVPLVMLWANLHAGVLLAVPFVASFGAYLGWVWMRTRRRVFLYAAVPVVVALVAWVCNPYGTGIYWLGKRIAEIPRVDLIKEWMPFFHSRFPLPWPTLAAGAVLVAAAVVLVVRRRREFHLLELLWMAALAGLMLWQRRQVGVAGMGLAMLLAPHARLAVAGAGASLARGWRFAVPAAAVVVMAVQISGANGNGGDFPKFGRNCTALPCYAGDFLQTHKPPGPLFNSYNFGGYLLNLLSPETPVYIDGRLDAYPHAVWLDQLALEEGRLSVEDFLQKYGVQTFVVTVKNSFGDAANLTSRLARREDFALVYFDDLAAIFVRKNPATAAYTRELGYTALTPWDLREQAALMAAPATREQALTQMGRLYQESPASAAVHSLAAFLAWAADDAATAAEELAEARRIDADNELLHLVEARLLAARTVQRRAR